MENIKLIIKGMLVGIANVIPGVSGGTIAVVLGIFDKLIFAVNNIIKDFVNQMKFLIPLGIGAVAGIFLFSKMIEFCLLNYSLPTNLFFIGLIAGSLPLIYKEANKQKKMNIPAFLVGILIVLTLSLMKSGGEQEIITTLTAESGIKLLIIGAIASAAMIMPGVSGSFVLVLLGYYSTFVSAVSHMNIPVLIVIAVGIIIGGLLMSKIIDILLKKAYTVTYSAILGLIVASLFSILLSKATFQTGNTLPFIAIGIGLAVAGFFIALKLGD